MYTTNDKFIILRIAALLFFMCINQDRQHMLEEEVCNKACSRPANNRDNERGSMVGEISYVAELTRQPGKCAHAFVSKWNLQRRLLCGREGKP